TVALGHPRAAEMSARSIAEYLGVDDHTVAAWKKRLPVAEVPHLPEPAPGIVKVVGRDGKRYPAKKNQKPSPPGKGPRKLLFLKEPVATAGMMRGPLTKLLMTGTKPKVTVTVEGLGEI